MKLHENAGLTRFVAPRIALAQGVLVAIIGLWLSVAAVAEPLPTSESLQAWQWFRELREPAAGGSGLVDCLLPPDVLDKARPDLADLRLRDAKGREVPFALRIRKPQVVQKSLPHTVINQGKVAKDEAVTLTLDLGEARVDHNAVEISTVGADFRRRVEVEGSDQSNKDWVVLRNQAVVMHVHAGAQMVESRRIDYAPSRFRYLRVRVYPDRNLADDKPEVSKVDVLNLKRTTGLETVLPAELGKRAEVTLDRHAGSEWFIEFSGLTVPCSQLSVDIAEESFVRAYRLELVRANEPNRLLAQGEWRRTAADGKKPLEIRLDSEVAVSKLRLIVTDDRNPPLNLTSVRYHAAARQVLFEASSDLAWPVKVYVGNPRATPANYDLARLLPDSAKPTRADWAGAGIVENPAYAPSPLDLLERWPWLVYAALGAGCLVLLAILVLLIRRMSSPKAKGNSVEDHASAS